MIGIHKLRKLARYRESRGGRAEETRGDAISRRWPVDCSSLFAADLDADAFVGEDGGEDRAVGLLRIGARGDAQNRYSIVKLTQSRPELNSSGSR